MGCLNYEQEFAHWFANIHLSGPCNRACNFCIGQHMMALDSFNNLDTWPLLGFEAFIAECRERNISDINITGTNTDPMLYSHLPELKEALVSEIPGLRFGCRTNGVAILSHLDRWAVFDKASLTICSFDSRIYKAMMGIGTMPKVERILDVSSHLSDLKLNVVLGPENTANRTHDESADVYATLERASALGFNRVNLREPYGQPHVGDPLEGRFPQIKTTFGMPTYKVAENVEATYWDVHYVGVQSVNLYAQGRVSLDYPITLGHSEDGTIEEQSHFPGGRIWKQWVNI